VATNIGTIRRAGAFFPATGSLAEEANWEFRKNTQLSPEYYFINLVKLKSVPRGTTIFESPVKANAPNARVIGCDDIDFKLGYAEEIVAVRTHRRFLDRTVRQSWWTA